MNFFYAELGNENLCVGVKQVNDEMKENNLIKLEDYDISILGKQYDNGEWKEVEETISEPNQSVTNEEIKDLLLASMMANLDIYMLITEQQNKD